MWVPESLWSYGDLLHMEPASSALIHNGVVQAAGINRRSPTDFSCLWRCPTHSNGILCKWDVRVWVRVQPRNYHLKGCAKLAIVVPCKIVTLSIFPRFLSSLFIEIYKSWEHVMSLHSSFMGVDRSNRGWAERNHVYLKKKVKTLISQDSLSFPGMCHCS